MGYRMMKKMLKQVFLLVITIVFLAAFTVTGLGYKLYHDALKDQNLPDRIAQVQSNPDYTALSALPETYINAVIAVEDHRFYKHPGIDLLAIGRAAWNDITSWSLKEGGSTITQQLAKNLYFTQEKTLLRKIAEMFMAFKLESKYSKNEILEFYVNSIYFGDGYYCVRQASNGYFSKEPIDMTDYEATLLAGIPNAPSVYSLSANPDLASQRQQQVIQKMIKYGFWSESSSLPVTP